MREERQQRLLAVGTQGRGVGGIGELEVEDGIQCTTAEKANEQQPEEPALAPQPPRGRLRPCAPSPPLDRRRRNHHAAFETPRPRRVQSQARQRRSGQQQGTDDEYPLRADAAGDRIRGKAPAHRPDRDPGGDGREEPLGLATGQQLAEREKEHQRPYREDLAGDEHQGDEHRRRIQAREQCEGQQRNGEQQQHARHPARAVGASDPATDQRGGRHQQRRAREQRVGQIRDTDALQEERLRNIEQREDRGAGQEQAEPRPGEDRPLRVLDAKAGQNAMEIFHAARA